jgi:hypothetical protein
MEIIFHKNLTRERWESFTLLEQMGNIGSEVGRAMKRQAEGNAQQQEAALWRALELFDLTRQDHKNTKQLKEISRAREGFLDYLVGDNMYQSTGPSWEKYFTDFAVAARNAR